MSHHKKRCFFDDSDPIALEARIAYSLFEGNETGDSLKDKLKYLKMVLSDDKNMIYTPDRYLM